MDENDYLYIFCGTEELEEGLKEEVNTSENFMLKIKKGTTEGKKFAKLIKDIFDKKKKLKTKPSKE